MRLLAPAYGYPGTNRVLWEGLLEAAHALGHIVINPGSGPGEFRDPAWSREVGALGDRGVPLLGYLDLAYSRKPVAILLAEAAMWRDWYGIGDFFLDCAPSSDVARTAEVAEILRQSARAGELVANAGVRTTSDVAQHFDAVVEHEGGPPFVGPDLESGAPWFQEVGRPGSGPVPASRAWIVHGADAAAAGATLRSASEAGVDEIWVTDLTGVNPYRDLPTYWPWLLDQLADPADRAAGPVLGSQQVRR